MLLILDCISTLSMKVAGNGQAKILTSLEVRALLKDGFTSNRDRALFGICLYTACRISEALHLHTSDVKLQTIVFRKGNTKGKLDTREVIVTPPLEAILADYRPKTGWYFPGKRGIRETLGRHAADRILKAACQRIGVEGVSTHSFRRTALTMMSGAGVPLRTIQKISGHHDLGVLQKYLEVSPEQLLNAVLTLQF
ncbi:tyrosine-type recombinase/integrase [Nostoc linckia]|nr:site-specific integrase [Nostoc linckia]